MLQARLADAAKQSEDAQERQHARLKEVARRWAGWAACKIQAKLVLLEGAGGAD